ncbi:Hypothetical protein ADU72_0784 [Pediococcus damnosus]|uniref:Uncharacterized protein n=1 Tax=Pediococcus damnosus TaxID=51663 RepID=A0AAC9FJG9_9LACO|nr:Hypothetical protein ADU69_1119 [Pediococcus damnosus]AMV63367.1 Hypothetical protein ADU70_1901 [Pediococcus damnosus]AMV65089.1 Hypothetical protein ADU71_1193 [Pediococcus damnosus]AMV66729.1 Hypothetical protein ADU72_0784 [Pediococcus damnosus]AMV69903.1 Hypothetical protein ADU73_1511 [Pediococcus damnosus]
MGFDHNDFLKIEMLNLASKSAFNRLESRKSNSNVFYL